MQIERKGTGPWPEAVVAGTKVSITACGETREYDCDELQGDAEVTLDVVRTADGGLAEGASNGVEYVATLIVPAARYEEIPVLLAVGPDGGSPEQTMESQRVPLNDADMEAIRLVLWTITENTTQEG